MEVDEKSVTFADHTFADRMRSVLYGQDQAIDLIDEQIDIYRAGLSGVDRPAGVFVLGGPTGSGKTLTPEATAYALHGSKKHLLRIDCGEYTADHEIAKLQGAPPGYLGHRETSSMITKSKLAFCTSTYSDLSIVCFDEIEKGAKNLHQLLLGILDKARLQTGDFSTVNFDKSLIFLTTNIGSEDGAGATLAGLMDKNDLRQACKKKFSLEFLNRVDAFIAYETLSKEVLGRVLDDQVNTLQGMIVNAMEDSSFVLELTPAIRHHILQQGDTAKFGARELARIFQRLVTRRVARLIIDRKFLDTRSGAVVVLEPRCKITVDFCDSQILLSYSDASLEELLRASLATTEWRKRNGK